MKGLATTISRRASLPLVLLLCAAVARAGDFSREGILDTSVGPDESAVNIQLVNSRWPDCATLESTIESIWRIEGVAGGRGQAKALALWKWFRILVSAAGGGRAYEGRNLDELVEDPHKILTVYGHHQCDGQSWAMVSLWRAAGLMAFDEAHHSHTTVALRYEDEDGVFRYHSFDPQKRFFYWDDANDRIGTWTTPIMKEAVFRRITAPPHAHSLRSSLRIGETVARSWQNTGHIVPSGTVPHTGKLKNPARADDYAYREGRTNGIYAVSGEELQTLQVETSPERYARQLYTGSGNVAASAVGPRAARVHPARADERATAVYRLASPYVATDGVIEATLTKSAVEDVCRLSLSRDGGPWEPVYDQKKPGTEKVTIDLGLDARARDQAHVYAAYDVRLRVEMQSATRPGGVGVDALAVSLNRMLNKRTLPNLMPGENVFRLGFDHLDDDYAVELRLDYALHGEKKSQVHVVVDSPYYFEVSAPGVALRKLANYDDDFGNEDVRMLGYSMRLVEKPPKASKPSTGLAADTGYAAFLRANPHPADRTSEAFRKQVAVVETDPGQTNGFLPQSRRRCEPDAKMTELIAKMQASIAADGGREVEAWDVAQQLGCYPAALDALISALPAAENSMTVYVLKAVSEIGDRSAIPALLAKWKSMAPQGTPGTRYIPDALVACGAGPEVVPDLVAPLEHSRFDLRFHVAHALGLLGGKQAIAVLIDLARDDPFADVREEARRGLVRLVAKPAPNESHE